MKANVNESMSVPRTIRLGDVARDRVTGYTGVVVSVSSWENNCDRYGLQPREVKDGKPTEAHSFDEPNLELVSNTAVTPIAVTRPSRPVELGDGISDRITTLEGRAIGRCTYLNGCSRIFVQPYAMKDGVPAAGVWVDEIDCDVVKPIEQPKPVVRTGGPRPEATR